MTARLAALCALLPLLALAAAPAFAAQPPEWPGCHNFAASLDAARQQSEPLSVAYTSSAATTKKDYFKMTGLEFNSSYKNMLNAWVTNATSDSAFLAMVRRLGCSTFPMILLCDGRGCVLGVFHEGTVIDSTRVKENDTRSRIEQAATAWSIVNWEKSADAQLLTLETKFKKRQYAEVSALLAQVDAQDKKFTGQLAAAVPWQPTGQQGQWFYEKEIKDAREKLKDAIRKELDADKELLAAGKRRQALDAIDPILFFKDDADLAKQIADLATKIDRTPITGGKPAPASASSATTAAPAAPK